MRRFFLLIHAALIGLCAAPTLGAAQETADTAAISVVRAVMEHRIVWLQDPTLFNPCRLYEVLGRPDDLGWRLGPHASRLLDQREKPCASPTLRAPISLVSVEVGDSTAAVQLRVTRGEYTYTEDYTLRKPEWRDWWGVSEIRMSGWGRYHLPPSRPSPPEDTVTERTYHLAPPQLTLPKVTVSSARPAQDITFQQFLEFRIDGSVKFEELDALAGDWPALKAAMGNPEEEVCEDGFVGEDCTFTWPGVIAWFTHVPSGEWEVSDVLIENGASLHYGAVTLSPGDSIAKLASLFPAAYANRGAASASDRWGCTHYAAVRRGIATVRFCYDPATTLIQKIVWWNDL